MAATRLVLASEVLGRLLAPEEGPLAGAWFHLYLYDEQRELLLPAFEGRPSPSQGRKPGAGAVGEAWLSGEYVLVRGAEVSDDTYGLTPDQQHRSRNLAVVAASPSPTAATRSSPSWPPPPSTPAVRWASRKVSMPICWWPRKWLGC